jgi:outer membrane protein assembly factor BamA
MSKKKIVVDAKDDQKGNITHIKIEGNQNFTSIKKAIELTEKGIINLVVVKPSKAKVHLRTRPDGITSNNLDDLAGDK